MVNLLLLKAFLVLITQLNFLLPNEYAEKKKNFADYWQYTGIAIEEPGYTVWGTSPIVGDDGKIHLFAARWPAELKVDPGWRSHSEIAHYVGSSPEGPFHFSDIALKGSGNETWDKFGAHNPALFQHPGGGFLLYFKSEGGKMGLAIARQIEGPYVQLPFPVTSNNQAIEDGYAFLYRGKVCLLTTDNHGLIVKGGGLLWKSDDGIRFDEVEQGFYPVVKYLGRDKLKKASKHYGGDIIKFERPQVLLINGEPAYMYAPSGYHFFGKESTASYILKFKQD